jgi:methenyltetrahydromethanopterin cyclohydrolase
VPVYPDSDDAFTMSGPAPTLSHGSDATYDRVEYTYDRTAAVVAARDQGGGNGSAASCVKDKVIPSCQY